MGENTKTASEGASAVSALSRREWGPFIGGAWEPADDAAEWIDVLEPATGSSLGRMAVSTPAVVDRAVRDARRAYESEWGALTARERGALLMKLAHVIRDHADELGELEAREVGKPFRDALRFDIAFCSAGFEYYGGLANSLHGDLLDQGPIQARVNYEPYGVVAAILPFNWPPMHFTKKCAPALAAGNTVVIKPGEQAPLTVLRLVELANEVLPPGVINAVTGQSAGAALTGHPTVERITFTGATATGRAVLRSAAENLTYATLELGGKNALMVLEDADMTTAVDVAIEGMFYNQGEACTSTARLLVHRSRYDEFIERFVAATDRLVVGDGMDAATDIGPMVDEAQQRKVLAYLQSGIDQGARVAYQGTIPDDERYAGGFWVPPTVLVDVEPQMTVAQEEIFGPIACIIPFEDEDQAIAIANGTAYGLTAAVITKDHYRASMIAERLEAGMIFVNNYMRRSFLGSPFGGVKGSGFGRENSAETLHEFVRAKNVRFPSGKSAIPGWPPAS